jgi:hypothetical protein
MRKATLPLDPSAVRAANAAVAADTGGRPLTMGPEDAEHRKKWMDAYVSAGGAWQETKPTVSSHPSPNQKPAPLVKKQGNPSMPCLLGQVKAGPTPPGPQAPPDPKTKVIKCGNPYVLVDKEGRKSGPENILEVVAPPSNEVVTVKCGSGCSCAGAKVEMDTYPPVKTAVNGPMIVKSWKLPEQAWVMICTVGRTPPKVHAVSVICGISGATIAAYTLRVFPDESIKINLSTETLYKKVEAFSNLINKLSSVYSKFSKNTIELPNRFIVRNAFGKFEVQPPEVSLEFEGSWKELPATDPQQWKVTYDWTVKLGLTFSTELKTDLIAAAAALTGVGSALIPIYHKISSCISADPPIYVAITFEIGGSGGGGSKGGKGYGVLEIPSSGKLNIGAQITSKVVEANISAQAELTNNLSGDFTRGDGFQIKVELLKWEGVKGVASIKLNVGKFFSTEYEKSVQLIEGREKPLIEWVIL